VSFWRRLPYERELLVRSNEFGPYEFSTRRPSTGKVTNTWWIGNVTQLITHGSFIYLSLPGGWLRAHTYLYLSMPSEEAALALVSAWGWEEESTLD